MLTVDIVARYEQPYPHVIVSHNASELPERPDWRLLAAGKGENIRSDWPARFLVNSEHVHSVWKDVARQWTCRAKWREFYVPVFGDAIRRMYPGIEARVGSSIEDWRVGMRGAESDMDVGLDFQIGINTPLTTTSSVKGPHVDSQDEIVGGLLYMREDDDDSSGGDLEVHSATGPVTFHGKRFVTEVDRLELAGTVPYRSDNGAFFVNGPRSIHGVSARAPSTKPRRLISICADMRIILFKLGGL